METNNFHRSDTTNQPQAEANKRFYNRDFFVLRNGSRFLLERGPNISAEAQETGKEHKTAAFPKSLLKADYDTP